jgi:hypothetical protein
VTVVHSGHRKINVSTVVIITGEEELWQGYAIVAHLEAKVINVSSAVNTFGNHL